jgi:hypothetical protein
MWDHFSMLKSDPSTCKKMIAQKMLNVYFGSFFNVEITPLPLGREKDSSKISIFGVIFNVEI